MSSGLNSSTVAGLTDSGNSKLRLTCPGSLKKARCGRALGCGEVKFSGQVMPNAKKITYRVSMKRVILRRLVMGIADAVMDLDGRDIYEGKDLQVGLFTSTEGF